MPIPAGTHQVRMEFAYDGGGLAKGGDVTLYHDGDQVGTRPGRGHAADDLLGRRDDRHRLRVRHHRHPRLHRPGTAGSAARSTGCSSTSAPTTTTTSSTRRSASASRWRGSRVSATWASAWRSSSSPSRSPSGSPRCSSCAAARPRTGSSPTGIAPPACSACWRRASPCSSASSCSSPSRATTSRGRVRRPRRSSWRSSSRPRSSSRTSARAELTGELICYARSVAGPQWERMEAGHAGGPDQPVGRRAVPHPPDAVARRADRGSGVRQVARPDIGPGGGAERPGPRRGRRHPGAAVDRVVLRGRRDLRVHALLRRPERDGDRPGGPHGLGRRRGQPRRSCSSSSWTRRSTRASAASNPWRWSGPSASSTRSWTPSGSTATRSRATSGGSRARPTTGRSRDQGPTARGRAGRHRPGSTARRRRSRR